MAKKLSYEELEQRIRQFEKEVVDLKQGGADEKHHWLKFLSETAMELIEFPFEENLLYFAADKIKELVGDSIVGVSTFNEETKTVCLQRVVGLGKFANAVIKIFGRDPVGMSFKIDDEAVRNLITSKLVEIPGEIIGLSPGDPKEVWNAFASLLGFGQAYSIGFSWKGRLFGNTTFILPKGRKLKNQYAIEILIRQISVALLRRQAEERVRETHDELEESVKERTRELDETNERLKLEIEERKQSEESLRAGEEKYRFITENMLDIVWVLGLDFRTVYVSPSIEKVLGYTPEERKEQSIEETVTPESLQEIRKRFMEELQRDKEDGVELDRSIIIEVEYYHKDGSTVWMENRVQAIRDSENAIVRMMGVSRDITERRRAEAALRESEEKFKGLFTFAPDAYYLNDLEGYFIDGNKAAEELTGYRREELIHKNLFELNLLPPEQLPKAAELLEKNIKGQATGPSELTLNRKDGSQILVEIRTIITKMKGESVVLGIARDMTERKRVQERIEAVHRLKEDLFGAGSLAVKMKRITDGVVDILGADFARIWLTNQGDMCDSGCLRAEVNEGPHVCRDRGRCLHLTASSGRYIHIDGSHGRVPFGCYKIGRLAVAEEPGFLTNDVTHDPRVHNHEWARELGLVSFAGYRMLSQEGMPMGVLALFSKQALSPSEEALLQTIAGATSEVILVSKSLDALQESEERYRDLYEDAPNPYFSISVADGSIARFNTAAMRLLGYDRETLMGMKVFDLYADTPEGLSKAQEIFKRFSDGESVRDEELQMKHKDGHSIWVIVSIEPARDREGNIIESRSIVIDISGRKHLEAQLQQARKMEAIATLAGGVAHEFNNALMGVTGNMELLEIDLSEDKRHDKYFEGMKRSSHRMSRLTDQLLAYAQGGKYRPENLKLDDFVTETLPILQHDLSPEVRVETHFSKDISYIKADPTQMQMVLSAILSNSNEAMEDEGLIRITAGNEDLDKDFTKQHPGLTPGPYVCLSIEDDGKGMDEEARNGVFEPFFTTKFQGRGMGMAAAYGIVMNHDGWISVDSELGKGTTVRIYLPAIKMALKKLIRAETEVVKGSGTILMIEDEDVVIDVVQAMLGRLGYRVMVANTGKDAVHIAETFDGDIDLALLDIKLPDMEGGKVYPLIMEARPDLKVIVSSGYAIDGPAKKILDAGAQDFIQKPFSFALLSEKLKHVLMGK